MRESITPSGGSTAIASLPGPGPLLVLPRRLLRWLQSLELSVAVGKVPRTELSNGYVVAEILQRHRIPEGFQEIYLPSFENGSALATKLSNWSRLKTIFKAQKFSISDEVVDATIHCKRGAAEHFMILLHGHLTSAKVSSLKAETPQFSDLDYQESLPYYARNTTSSLIKSNVRPLEARTQPDELKQTGLITSLVGDYVQRDREEREENPARFDRRPLNDKGIPSQAERIAPRPVDTAAMHTTAQFLKATRQKPLAPIGSTQRLTTGVVGPVGHTDSLNVTKRRDETEE